MKMDVSPLFRHLQERGRIVFPVDKLKSFCEKWQIAEISVFGSILRDDFQFDTSDLDVLVTFLPDDPWNLLDFVSMEQELAELAGRRVDLLEKCGVENSRNPIRKAEILNSARVIYSKVSVYEPA